MPILKLPKIFLVKIEGLSLFPDLQPNNIFLAANFLKIKKGKYLIFQKQNQWLVKQVVDVNSLIKVKDNFNNFYLVKPSEVIGILWKKLF